MILGVIVTFYPLYDDLNYNLAKLTEQVDKILIVNNGPPIDKTQIFLNGKLNIIENHENIGIAKALNMALDYAELNLFTHMFTLDQDSRLSDKFVRTLRHCFIDFGNVGIVGCNIIEKELGLQKTNNVKKTQEVAHVITSGALNLVKALKEAGGYDEKLFIDMVDLDICYRVYELGYKIVKSAEVTLEHRIGTPVVRRLFFKKHFIRNHPPFRKYFFVRNRLYIAFKYRKRGFKFVLVHLLGICYYTFIVLVFEKEKWLKLKMILRGIYDFLRGNYANDIIKRREQ